VPGLGGVVEGLPIGLPHHHASHAAARATRVVSRDQIEVFEHSEMSQHAAVVHADGVGQLWCGHRLHREVPQDLGARTVADGVEHCQYFVGHARRLRQSGHGCIVPDPDSDRTAVRPVLITVLVSCSSCRELGLDIRSRGSRSEGVGVDGGCTMNSSVRAGGRKDAVVMMRQQWPPGGQAPPTGPAVSNTPAWGASRGERISARTPSNEERLASAATSADATLLSSDAAHVRASKSVVGRCPIRPPAGCLRWYSSTQREGRHLEPDSQ
jgi:hypothetical protein